MLVIILMVLPDPTRVMVRLVMDNGYTRALEV